MGTSSPVTCDLTLICWVYGDDINRKFAVEISSTGTVGILREAIKDKNPVGFRDIDARALVLYKACLPCGEGYGIEDALRDCSPLTSGFGNPLHPSQKLSAIFVPLSLDEQLHVVVYSPTAAEPTVVAPDMTLNCWMHGDDIGRAFSVKISSTKTVSALKEAIKDKTPVKYAETLDLYKACLPCGEGDGIEDALRDRSPLTSGFGNPLRPLQKLSAIFVPLSPDEQLHVVVYSPPAAEPTVVAPDMTLNCWMHGDDIGRMFSVKISSTENVSALKEAIKDKTPIKYANTLDLYKACLPCGEGDDVEDALRDCSPLTSGFGKPLRPSQKLSAIFMPLSPQEQLHVVVVAPSIPSDSGHLLSTDNSRLFYIQKLARSPSVNPSEQGEPQNFKKLQSTDCGILWTRPPGGALSIPVILLHPILGQFVHDCHNHEPTRDDNTFVLELSFQMSNFFEKESERRDALLDIFRDHHIPIVPSSLSGCTTDSDLHVNGRRYVILEVENEVSAEGTEPYCQGIIYYMKANQGEVAKDENAQFNFPCLIIAHVGAHLSFSGAVWVDRPNYQVLSPGLPLFWHPTDVMMRQSAARQIGAFRKACQSLKELYERFDANPVEFMNLQPEYPHPRSYKTLDGKTEMHFKYIRALEGGKLLFVVKTDAGEELCVKFVQRYSVEAHRRCAEWGISPSLRGRQDVLGGWQMIVMDFLKDYEGLHSVKNSLPRADKERLREELRSRLTNLHQEKFVHGDVRDANVMVKKEKDRLGWKLMDFDWSGEIDHIRYPMNVNHGQGIRRPEGAIDGELILADHDLEMLDYLF